MEWEIVRIGETSGKNVPFVSIGRGQLIFSAEACRLVNDDGNYKYAQLLTAKEGRKKVVAVKFLHEYEENSIPVKRKKANGKDIQGMTIANKGIITELFGKDGSNDGTKRRRVELVVDKPNMLKVVD